MVRRWLPICVGVLALAHGPAGRLHAQGRPAVPGLPAGPAPDPVAGWPAGDPPPLPPVPPRTAFQPPTAPAVPPDPPQLVLPGGVAVPVPEAITRQFRFSPRYNRPINVTSELLDDQVTRRAVITGGVIVNVNGGDGRVIEFATDAAVVWARGVAVDNVVTGFQTEAGDRTEVEVYLAGNVVVRTVSAAAALGVTTQTVRAERVYYDVSRNRAVALDADLQVGAPRLPDGAHLRGKEIRRLDELNWQVLNGSVFSSALPSDPGLRLDAPRIDLQERRGVLKNIFGVPYKDVRTGDPVVGVDRLVTLRNMTTRVADVPVFYLPRLRTTVEEPLGPLLGLGFGQDRIFGTQVYTSWDVYKLIGYRPPPGHGWRLNLDYLSDRGPAAGTDYRYALQAPPGEFGPGGGFVKLYGINDGGVDVLGGDRGPEPPKPQTRGRATWRHLQDLGDLTPGLSFQGQLSYLSDKNFLEQFFRQEWETGPNQETFAYLKWQRDTAAVTALVAPRLARPWVAQTEWYPRLDGYVAGESFWDLLVYSASANAGYARTRPSEVNPLPVLPTDRRVDFGRFDLLQEVSLPADLGPFKVAPYATADLTYYTQDLTGAGRGRVIGGGGARGSIPFSRLYADAASELFNVKGLYHKVVFAANYYNAWSTTPYTRLPLADRLNDDAIDQAYRNIVPFEPTLVGGAAGQLLRDSAFLTTPTPYYNPQQYAIRRLAWSGVDTRDSVHVLQGQVRQRFQTKRGYPGLEHTVDLFTLNLSGSWFPQPGRDNFGKPFAFLEYNALWNVGDRVSAFSDGWVDPYNNGVRYFNVGTALDRPDRTNWYLGYRHTDPINSRQVTVALGYQMSRRYHLSLGTSYDFGFAKALVNSFGVTRTGSDVTVTVGATYNALVNNFGFQFLIVPNLLNNLAPGRFQALSPVR